MHAGLPHKDDSRPSPPLRASPANSYTAGQPSHTQVALLHNRLIIWVNLLLTACVLHSLATTCDLQLSKSPKLSMKQRSSLPDEYCCTESLVMKSATALPPLSWRGLPPGVYSLLTGSFSCEGVEHTAGGQSLPRERWQASC